MALTLSGAERDQFAAVLQDWHMGGSPAPVEWAGRAEQDRQQYLPGLTPKRIKECLHEYVKSGGKVSRVDEQRDGYRHWKYHYDLWPTIDGVEYYFETRFDSSDANSPVIYIMRFKPN